MKIFIYANLILSLFLNDFSLASMLVVEDYGMEGVSSSYLGKIKSINKKKGKIKLKLEKVWHRGKKKPIIKKSKKIKTFVIYGGVEWTDPNVSPMDTAFEFGTELSNFKTGERAVVVTGDGYQMMKYYPTLSKDLDFEYKKKKNYKKSETKLAYTHLKGLLHYRMALEFLKKNKKLKFKKSLYAAGASPVEINKVDLICKEVITLIEKKKIKKTFREYAKIVYKIYKKNQNVYWLRDQAEFPKKDKDKVVIAKYIIGKLTKQRKKTKDEIWVMGYIGDNLKRWEQGIKSKADEKSGKVDEDDFFVDDLDG